DGIKALSAILPKDCRVGAVGGVSDKDFAAYGAIGVRTFGLGSSLYKPGMEAEDVAKRAKAAVSAWDDVFIGKPV
ncbi:MAG: 2-dehydro-3-deoxy-6-phosphogalactonate aldolase, partial [Notoacmeibacter sp.]